MLDGWEVRSSAMIPSPLFFLRGCLTLTFSESAWISNDSWKLTYKLHFMPPVVLITCSTPPFEVWMYSKAPTVWKQNYVVKNSLDLSIFRSSWCSSNNWLGGHHFITWCHLLIRTFFVSSLHAYEPWTIDMCHWEIVLCH